MFNKKQLQRSDNEKFYLRVAIILVILAIIVSGFFILSTFYPIGQLLRKNNGKYQAVFLSSGQVYFGMASKLNSKYVELSSVYYFQLKDSASGQTAGQGTTIQTTPQTGQSTGEMTLVKLGSELHGPKDKMLINQSQVLFIEDLRSDSKVVQAIESNQSK